MVDPNIDSNWRLANLVDKAIQVGGSACGESRRIQWTPDARLVRYYTTLGLVDRPGRMQGRTAYYGRRHLLQLIAIKTLQGQGMTLREIQDRVTGLPNQRLESLADLEPGWKRQLDADAPAGNVETPPERQRFWDQVPVSQPLATLDGPDHPVEDRTAANADWRGLELGEGLVLLMKCPCDYDPEEVRRRATPLIEYLVSRSPAGRSQE